MGHNWFVNQFVGISEINFVLLISFGKVLLCTSAKLGIGIEADAAGIGFSASNISVRYRSIPVRTGVQLFRYWTVRHLTKLQKCTSMEGSSVRLCSSHGAQ